MKRIWMFVAGLLLLTMACAWGNALPGIPTQPSGIKTANPNQSAGTTPSPLPVNATASAAPKPTRSPTPTRVPIPTRTPVTPTEVLPTPPKGKVILIEYFDKYLPGVPLLPSDAYVGKNLPRLVVYTDGQVIWRDDTGALFETSMTDASMCALLGGIQTIGFFKVEADGTLGAGDPIYVNIPQKYLDITDSTSFLLAINGNPSKWILIYRPYVDTLITPVKSTWELFNSFVPSNLRPYRPKLYGMWIESEQKLARKYGAGEDLQVADWPSSMTRLARLLGDAQDVQLGLDPEGASPILSFYNPVPGVKVFREGKNRYSVILRPLLPHERLNDLPSVPQEAQRYALPFSCKK